MPEANPVLPPTESQPQPGDFNIQERMTPKELEDLMNSRSEELRKLESEAAKQLQPNQKEGEVNPLRQLRVDAELEEYQSFFRSVDFGDDKREKINLIRAHCAKLARLITDALDYEGIKSGETRQAVGYLHCVLQVAQCAILKQAKENPCKSSTDPSPSA